jgi:hypothetical protein
MKKNLHFKTGSEISILMNSIEMNEIALDAKLQKQMEKAFMDNLSQFLKFYTENNPEFIIPDNFQEDFKNFVKNTTKKETVDNRCTGIKKDGDRCNGKKKAGHDLCTIHLRPQGAATGGRLTKIKNQRLPPVVELEVEETDSSAVKGCQYVFGRGKNKGDYCGKSCNGSFCKTHSKKAKTPLSPEIITPEIEEEADTEYINRYIPDNHSDVTSVTSNVSGKKIKVYMADEDSDTKSIVSNEIHDEDDLFGEEEPRNYEGYEY